MKRILAIDFATRTGWAYRGEGPDILSGVWDFTVKKDESSGMRLVRFESKLMEMIPLVDVVVFESVSAGHGPRASFSAVKLQTKMQAIIEYIVEQKEGIEYKGYNLEEIKNHAVGKGKGKGSRDKEAMVKSARKRWPDEEIEDDNQADALWLLDLSWKDINGDSEW